MRIVQILPRLETGGAERGTVELNCEYVRRNLDSVVISAGGTLAAKIVADGGQHICLPVAGKNPLSAPYRALLLGKTLRALKPDIVHVRSRVPAWLHKLCGGRRRYPTVSTVHGQNSVNFYSRIMTDADALICATGFMAEHIKAAYAVPASRITIIPRGIDHHYFDPQQVAAAAVQQLRSELALGERRVIAQIGRISANKGQELLLRAMALLPRGDNVAVIVGSGAPPHLARLQKLAADLHITDRVRFVGNRSDIRAFYALAHIVVSCSVRPETFGRTVLEALAMNCHVAASDQGGPLDIIGEHAPGRLFASGNHQALGEALATLLKLDAPTCRQQVIQRIFAG